MKETKGRDENLTDNNDEVKGQRLDDKSIKSNNNTMRHRCG